MWWSVENNGGITADEYGNIKTILNDNVADAKGASEDLEAQIKEIEDKINHIYVNLITILGIFVTVFSLVISNAQRAYDIFQSPMQIGDILLGIFISNLSTVIAIACLLWLINHFLGIKK